VRRAANYERKVGPASDCPDLTACDTRRQAYGTERHAILTHFPELHADGSLSPALP
jgi:hypothetical protein